MIAKREVGRFRQVKSKTDACLLEWWRDKGSVARDRAGGVVWGWLSKLARRALAMPATSAAAERLFSQASSVLKPNRKRIKVVNSLLMPKGLRQDGMSPYTWTRKRVAEA